MSEQPARPFGDLRDTGLLWLINRVVFHPRGFALGLVRGGDGQIVGWRLLGDGTEVWHFEGDEDTPFARAEEALQAARSDGAQG
jgi:hypothetical protein